MCAGREQSPPPPGDGPAGRIASLRKPAMESLFQLNTFLRAYSFPQPNYGFGPEWCGFVENPSV